MKVGEETAKEAALAHLKGILVMYLAAYLLAPIYPDFGLPWLIIWLLWPGVFFKRGTAKGVFALGAPSAIMPYLGDLIIREIGISCYLFTGILSIFVLPWFVFYALRYAIRPHVTRQK